MTEYKEIQCKRHGLIKAAKHKNGNAAPAFRCMLCSAEATKRVVQAKRDRVYKEYGDKCSICGYNNCREALEWHHLDPSTKEVEPSKVFSRSYERIIEELSKCILVCANCHREIHVKLGNFGN
jgi:hypothetical protein